MPMLSDCVQRSGALQPLLIADTRQFVSVFDPVKGLMLWSRLSGIGSLLSSHLVTLLSEFNANCWTVEVSASARVFGHLTVFHFSSDRKASSEVKKQNHVNRLQVTKN